MTTKLDVTGERYGRLVGVKTTASHNGHTLWLWQCDCGNKKKIPLVNVRMGYTKSCGCLNLERVTKHGLSKHWLYSTYCGIKGRCNNTNYKRYKDYGGRGVKCSFQSFQEFYLYVTKLENYNKVKEQGLTINRINNDGNYEKGNLEWSTQSKQEANKRLSKNNTSGYEGVSFCKRNSRWYAMLAVKGRNPYIGCYKTKDEAIGARKKAEQKYRSTIKY